MLTAALALVGLAALAGLALVVRLAHAGPGRARWPAALHGLVGVGGFLALLAGLGGPARGVNEGAGAFGAIAAGLLAAALLAAAVIVAAQLRRRPAPAPAIVVHAILAVSGIVMLAVYASMPPG